MNWLEALDLFQGEGRAHVLVTLVTVKGSAPRAAGTKMVVTGDKLVGSVGGGGFEHQLVEAARDWLSRVAGEPRAGIEKVQLQEINLAKDAAQCCGGVVTVLLEYMPASLPQIVIFGAGHVAQALVSILAELPLRLDVIDSRADMLARVDDVVAKSAARTATISSRLTETPELLVAGPDSGYDANTLYLVITHSHDLDFAICEAVLSSEGSPWCGLIASQSKSAGFRSRLSKKGFTDLELERLVAPVGIQQMQSKEPMAVAVSIAAQLLTMPQLAP